MSSDRDKLIAEALRMADFHDRFGKKNETAILLRALVAELVRDTPKDTEWEYGYGYTENGRIRPVVTKGDGSIRFGNYPTIEAAQAAMDNDLRWRPELHLIRRSATPCFVHPYQ